MNGTYQRLMHTFPPLYKEDSEILILGSFPSVKSRDMEFYYGHPQNRFWRVMAEVLSCEVPETIEQKKQMLLQHHVALWDVIAECDIIGSSDSSIRNVKVNPLREILEIGTIKEIYANGATAARLYRKYCEPTVQRTCVQLPSTSPANAAYSLERLCREWFCIKKDCSIE